MKQEEIYLYTFVDNDSIDSMYHLLTKRNCTNLIESIERFYYEFEYYETIDELVEYLKEQNADNELIDYIMQFEEIEYLTDSGICDLTYNILDELDILLSFEEKRFNY